MLYRLIYASEPAVPIDAAGVEALLAKARRNNELKAITGLLAFDSRWFLQVLEGDRDILSDLYADLVRDPLHRNLKLIEHVAVRERHFADWSMGFAAAHQQARRIYLRHTSRGQFEPGSLSADAALHVLRELAQLNP